ncbi:MAG: hypothetical protein EOM24_31835 [Chloroflexia bacterium]|nr:hypothetical protein [Chloroflexia bacterium]
MTFPREPSLAQYDDGLVLVQRPVRELAALRSGWQHCEEEPLKSGQTRLMAVQDFDHRGL